MSRKNLWKLPLRSGFAAKPIRRLGVNPLFLGVQASLLAIMMLELPLQLYRAQRNPALPLAVGVAVVDGEAVDADADVDVADAGIVEAKVIDMILVPRPRRTTSRKVIKLRQTIPIRRNHITHQPVHTRNQTTRQMRRPLPNQLQMLR
jgi:predicted RNA methylase